MDGSNQRLCMYAHASCPCHAMPYHAMPYHPAVPYHGRHETKAGFALSCADCSKWFHAKCERLDYTNHELQQLQARRRYVCRQCEEVRLRQAGYDPSKGRFQWQCKFCPKMFDDEAEATQHGKRCAVAESKRQWSCPCNGKLNGDVQPHDPMTP